MKTVHRRIRQSHVWYRLREIVQNHGKERLWAKAFTKVRHSVSPVMSDQVCVPVGEMVGDYLENQ